MPSDYLANKKYSVLVYYRTGLADEATEIREYLLHHGFKSSAIYTNFDELGSSAGQEGTVRVVFTKYSAAKVTELKAKQKFRKVMKKVGDKIVDRMNTGDIQILLF
jgi:hypothetical protein